MTKSHQLKLPFPHLRFSPSILARLGEELNPNADQGLLELVKNAFDADARTCTIELSDATELGGSVKISDDGVGMDSEAIEANWLVLGTSSKNSSEPTALGRTPVGNKGLGRLAALRLGDIALLVSCPEDEPTHEYVLEINWRAYDDVQAVEEVPLEIKRRKRKARHKPGTTISLSNLRVRLQRNDVKRLARGVLLLADPFGDPAGFRPILKATEFDDLAKLVENRYFDDAEFHLIASLDEDGFGRAQVVDWKGNELYSAEHAELQKRQGDRPYDCPAVQFDLWNFILDKKTFSTRTSTQQEVQDWLGEFGGVHLYVQGFRVSPYGNPGNDWLDLNLSRSRSPEKRPSTNNSIGIVSITDPGDRLMQKTDRTGLIEDHTFSELKRFATDSLNWMAKRRLAEREARRTKEKAEAQSQTTKARDSVEEVLKDLPEKSQRDVQVAFDRYARARDREATAWKKEVQLYRTLSTAGITAALFAHESRHPLQLIQRNIKQVQRLARDTLGEDYDARLARPVDRVLSNSDALRAFGNLTLSQIDNDKRRAKRVEIHAVINDVEKMFAKFVKQRKVLLELVLAPANPYLRASVAAIESIVTNLMTNSLRAFEKATPGKHRIVFRTIVESDRCVFRCLDNGPGIQELTPRDVWLPGETTYPNGTGLGLTIVRDTVADLGGSVEAIAAGELGGAEFVVEVPILGS